MTANNIIFNINDSNYIRIELLQQLSHLFRYDEVTITLHTQHQKYILYQNDFIIEALQSLSYSLQKALTNALNLHESITKDIGYLWNRCLWGNSKKLVEEIGAENQIYWVGERYLLWSGQQIDSWLYEKNNQLFLEVTPTYQWPPIPIKEARKQPGFISYREFMKQYTPYAIIPLEKKIAQEWLEQTEQLIKLIEANDSKYFIKQEE